MEDANENEVNEYTEDEALQEGEAAQKPSKRSRSPKKKVCNQRLEELATPPRRIFLSLYNTHAYHLPPEKVEYLKDLLQKLYAMTPEETAKYFAEVRAMAKKAALRRKLKIKLRKLMIERQKQKQRDRAYKLFRKLLKCGIKYAAENPIPPLVSLRLRYLSDVVLEQLCFLREIPVPDRTNPCIDELATFMISVADWMAIAIERLYYAAQSAMNEEEEARRRQMEAKKKCDNSIFYNTMYLNQDKVFLPDTTCCSVRNSLTDATFAPQANSTPKGSLDNTFAPQANSTPKGSLDNTFAPQANSTPKGSLDNTFNPQANSTPKGSVRR